MSCVAKIIASTVATPVTASTTTVRLEAYSDAPSLPPSRFAARYVGRNAVTIIPPITSSYSMFGRLFATE